MFGPSITYKPGFWARFFISKAWKLTLDSSSPEQMQLSVDTDVDLLCANVTSVVSSKGVIWDSVEIRSKTYTANLPGLSSDKASKLRDDLLQFVNNFLAKKIESDKAHLDEVDKILRGLTQNSWRYLAHSDVSEAISHIPGDLAHALSHPLFDIVRMPSKLVRNFPASFEMLTDPDTRNRYNQAFLAEELRRYEKFFSGLGGVSLSDEQREACIRLEDSNLLVASAGSGKTATMVGKVAYVLSKDLFNENEVLVLAFNSGAASELKNRIAVQLGVNADDLKCNVSTFHALGRAIIEQVHGRPPQLANWVEHPAGESQLIEQIIQEQLDLNPEFRTVWTELLVLFPKADLPVESFSSEDDYNRYIADRARGAGATVSTLAGIFVKSLQEQTIANWLWLHSVQFEYERQVPYREVGGNTRFVQPDFYYPKTKTLHEHFAINKDGTSPFEKYVEHAQSKRDGYGREKYDFFETTSAQAYDESLLSVLEGQLRKRKVEFKHRTFIEVEKALEPSVLKRYHNLVSVCIKHIRSGGLTLEVLLERAKTLKHPARARRFAHAVWILAEAYNQKLQTADRIDFESMIGDAVKLIETGRYHSPYSIILVDEFQDISEPRANLIKALKHQKAYTRLFAVGDDWQSIYRFAGSDISIFTRFSSHFGTCWQGRLETTYRCNQLIAETAAQFVQRNPEQLKKSVRSRRDAISRSIRVIPVEVEWGKPSMSTACNQVLNRLNAFAAKRASQWQSEIVDKLKVLVLFRYNMTNPFKVRAPQFSHVDVSSMTFHRSKGLEADYTILLDISEGSYGVPSQIEDDELLNLVKPVPETFQYAEERRLFYVALTRASRGIFILTNQQRPSRYIDELQGISPDDVEYEMADGSPIEICPRCKEGFLSKKTRRDGGKFVGCSQYPKCKHTASAE